MADFCKQCSIETFGGDTGDLADLTTREDELNGLFCVALCEGCGPIQVRKDGTCLGDCMIPAHGVTNG